MKLYLLKQKPGPGMSKRMFDSAAQELNIEIEYRDLVTPRDYFQRVLKKLMDDPQVAGFNVTIPYKVDIKDAVEPDEDVAACGAVNCVRVDHERGVFQGFNTDYKGIMHPLKDLTIHSAIVAGAGGAARAAVYALIKRGVSSIYLFNRTEQPAQQIQTIFPHIAVHPLEKLDSFLKTQATDCLINTTPLGMNPNPRTCLPVSVDALKNCSTVFDVVYKPLQTKLLTLAKTAGCHCINGLEMLVEQHAENVKIWNLPEKEAIIQHLLRYKR
ncbi:MAG TPA: hypothetical protein P5107_05315 [Thermotogota bacterium]|nr:hypothetical protein [Thermotogota bacterium]HPF16468.1 hypothetical protein [Thermotogota bacterium]HRW34456.1 hypothetical protein [Thermotogota bacterium]